MGARERGTLFLLFICGWERNFEFCEVKFIVLDWPPLIGLRGCLIFVRWDKRELVGGVCERIVVVVLEVGACREFEGIAFDGKGNVLDNLFDTMRLLLIGCRWFLSFIFSFPMVDAGWSGFVSEVWEDWRDRFSCERDGTAGELERYGEMMELPRGVEVVGLVEDGFCWDNEIGNFGLE